MNSSICVSWKKNILFVFFAGGWGGFFFVFKNITEVFRLQKWKKKKVKNGLETGINITGLKECSI